MQKIIHSFPAWHIFCSYFAIYLDLAGHTKCAEHSKCFSFKDLISMLALWTLCEIENARKGIPLERMGRKATDLNPGNGDKVAELPGGNGSLCWLHLAWQLPINKMHQWRCRFAIFSIYLPKFPKSIPQNLENLLLCSQHSLL